VLALLNAAQWVAASEDPQHALPKAIQVFTLLVNGLLEEGVKAVLNRPYVIFRLNY
jgi:hypothetical protein